MVPVSCAIFLAGALFAISSVGAPGEKRGDGCVWTSADVDISAVPNNGLSSTPAFSTASPVEEAKAPPISSISGFHTSDALSTFGANALASPSISSSTLTALSVSSAQTEIQTSNNIPSGSGSNPSSDGTGLCTQKAPCTGQMTFYDTATLATNPSFCGTTNDGEVDLVLALSVTIMTDSNCGKSVTIECNGVQKVGKVVDKCVGCDKTSIDLSRSLFKLFGSFSEGVISNATWYFN